MFMCVCVCVCVCVCLCARATVVRGMLNLASFYARTFVPAVTEVIGCAARARCCLFLYATNREKSLMIPGVGD